MPEGKLGRGGLKGVVTYSLVAGGLLLICKLFKDVKTELKQRKVNKNKGLLARITMFDRRKVFDFKRIFGRN